VSPGCIAYPYVHPSEIIINGVAGSQMTGVTQLDTSYANLSYGTTIAFWTDEVLGLKYGPAYSNAVSTRIAAKLISETRFFSMSEAITTSALSKEFGVVGLTVQVTLANLINLFYNSGLTSDATVGDFIRFVKRSNLLSDEEILRLQEFINRNRLQLEDSIRLLLQRSLSFGFSLTATSSAYLSLVSDFGLQQNVVQQTMSVDSRTNLLESATKADSLKVSSRIGSPNIRLVKHVDKTSAWFGSTLVYSFDIINDGSIGAKDIVIVDVLPLGLTFQSLLGQSIAGTFHHLTVNGRSVLLFSLDATLPASNSGHIRFEVKIPELPNDD
jgi:uncharacterized repeat protein (TIGR01451 family)